MVAASYPPELTIPHCTPQDRPKEKVAAAINALERSPESGWLPSDPDARSAVARDLAQMLGERIRAMRD